MKQGKAGCCSADTTKRSDWARMSEGTSRIRTQVGTNGNSWKPKTCHQGAISVAVRGTFLGSAPDSWVHFLYFSHSGRITHFQSPAHPHSSLITSCLKTSRQCVMSLNRVRGKWVSAWSMMYFVRTTPTCLQTHFTLRTVKLTKLQHKPETELRLLIKSHVFPLKATQPRTFWTLSGASRIRSLWESREFWETAGWSCRKPAEQRLSGSFSFCPGQRDGGCHGDRWLSPFTVMWAVPAGVGRWIHH